MREQNRERFALAGGSAPFLLGFMAGIALLVIGRSGFLGKSGLMGTDTTGYLSYLEIHRNRLFLYVLRLRFRTVFMMILLSFTPLGRWVRQVYAAWYGLAFGMILTASYAVYGLRGLWLVCICLVPQIFIYVPSFLLLCSVSKQICDEYVLRYGSGGKQQLLFRCGIAVLCCILGCLAEGYLNPLIVMKMLKNF